MTIFDMQGGEVDGTDFGVPATGPRHKSSEEYQPVEAEMGGKEEQQPQPGDKAPAIGKKKSGKDKKKGKKEKEKEKEKEKSEHFRTCICN